MTCKVKIIEDSLNPYNKVRLTTAELMYWRPIHAEVLTHRMFSRNASSSRAIPISTFLKQVWSNPARPIHWGANQPGMKARHELTGIKKWLAIKTWDFTGKVVCSLVWTINKLVKPHKQVFNRLLEPWQYISVIITSTEWDNFFELRDHPDAQPEIQELARELKYQFSLSTPVERVNHLPYVSYEEREKYSPITCMQLSTARCARVSYLTHDGKVPSFNKDMELFNQLVGSIPRHSSPAEHPSTAVESIGFNKNFRSWRQFRADLEKIEVTTRK